MSKLVVLPTANKNNEPTYHLKSECPQIDFSEFNEKRAYEFEEKNPSDKYSQIYITTSYTISIENSEYFCRLDTISPFEVNKLIKDFSKEDFIKVLDYHAMYDKDFIDNKLLTFPNGVRHTLIYRDLDVNTIADSFLST